MVQALRYRLQEWTPGVDGSKVVDGSTVGHNVEKSKKLPRGSARVAEAFKQLRRGFNLL